MKKGLLLFACIFTFLGASAQGITLSGVVHDSAGGEAIPYANVLLRSSADSVFVTGGITDENGLFKLTGVRPGGYVLGVSYIGYRQKILPVWVGKASEFLDLGRISIAVEDSAMEAVDITATVDAVGGRMDKKSFSVDANIAQSGGTILDVMKNLPGVGISEDNKVQLRGSDKVVVLIDGKQSALTGFGNQTALDNIPASAIERIEIINNPSAKYDANGNAGIINIIMKKENNDGFNGKVGLSGGLGALWIKRENLPTIAPQYQFTPKVNPSLSLNYRRHKVNVFLQADYLYTQTLNKNEFVTRVYENGDSIIQQTRRNRNTGFSTVKAGVDYTPDDHNLFTISGLFGTEKIIDHGEEPFFSGSLDNRIRLWQFLEDELKTTVTASAIWQHKFRQPGRLLNMGFNYTFHREDEKYFFTNIMPTFTGYDSFKLLSDEHVGDFNADYIRPVKYGRFETGVKIRKRAIPIDMLFIPGENSPLDTNAGGWARYNEFIPAVYGNYIIEQPHFEVEAGLRGEYVNLDYQVNPEHSTYRSNGYDYIQPFPNTRFTLKLNDRNRLSVFYNRRVDRPNEVDIRIFPKYDDAEIIKVGNPALRPMFTNAFELGYKTSWKAGYFYSAAYHKIMDATITRIASTAPGSDLIYNIFQNAGRSYNTGIEMMLSQNFGEWAGFNLNLNGYQNIINGFSVVNLYPVTSTFTADTQQMFSGNAKLNGLFHIRGKWDLQFTAMYLAPDIIPQGKTGARFSLDAGIKKSLQQGKGSLFLNATDLANTMQVIRTIQGDGFTYHSTDYYETQVVRIGYTYRF